MRTSQWDVARSTAQLIALPFARGLCTEQCLLQSVAQGRCTGHCMGMSHVISHGIMPRAWTECCMGKWHGEVAEMGSPTTDPIPIPAPAQPQVRIIAAETGNARVPVRLSCYIWGFYPPEVTVIWLHNGDIAEPDDYNPISAIPNGDWTYQTQVSLLVAPVAGDTYTYSVQHVSLQEPLLEDWSPGLMPEVTILVAVSVRGEPGPWSSAMRTLLTPLLPPAGYTPLPGDNYPAGNGVPICISEG
uniref:Ig-like domain-containing protein n=1 Tax=Anas platyrhynchos platyrhynchos TaxID=8840 RepID=A0A493T0R0_ANAPP